WAEHGQTRSSSLKVATGSWANSSMFGSTARPDSACMERRSRNLKRPLRSPHDLPFNFANRWLLRRRVPHLDRFAGIAQTGARPKLGETIAAFAGGRNCSVDSGLRLDFLAAGDDGDGRIRQLSQAAPYRVADRLPARYLFRC